MSETLRAYTPPAAGSFDPYTAAITGRIPAFFGLRELPPPPALTPASAPEVLPSSDGGDGGLGGLGSGNVNMGGQMAGSIDLGPNPGTLDRSFGQEAYGRMGSTLGTLAGMATGVPGLGLGLGALGTLADVRGLNADLAMMGLPQEVAFGPAFASNLTAGYLGTPAATQFGNILGFEALAEAPLSAFASPSIATPSAPEVVTSDFGGFSNAETQAVVDAINDAIAAGFGPESFGYSSDPGGFSSAEAQAAAQAVSDAIGAGFGPESGGWGGDGGGPSGDPGGGTDSAADSPGAGGGVGADGSVGSGGDAWKKGGLVKLAEGGLVPLAGGGKIAIGPGGGLDDLIPTSINGRRAAALSDGEFVIPADVVSMMGDGSSNAGARRLYDMVRQVRDAKTGTTKQAGPLPVGEILKRSMSR